MMQERYRSNLATGVSSSKDKASGKKSREQRRRDQRLDAACMETLESRFLLSLTVTGVVAAPVGLAHAENSLTAITSGETTPSQGTFTDFGPTAANIAITRQYQVKNTGASTVNFTGTPLVSISGDTTDFTVTSQLSSASLAPNATANFTVQFDPSAAGNDVANISIASDDPSSPFMFQVQGESLTTTAVGNAGLEIATTVNGNSAISAANGDLLMMNYTGYLTDGSIFDTNTNPATPFQFTLGAGQVIAGWDQGLVGAKAGEQRTLIIPGALAYPGGSGIIPAGAEIIFTTTVVNELRITGGSPTVEIPNGDTSFSVNDGTDFGAHLITDPAVTHTFTLTAGTGNLSSMLSNPAVSVAGNASFSITQQPVLTSGTGTFVVQYAPSVGTTNATVTIANSLNAADNLSFGVQAEGPAAAGQIAITGANANATTPITSGEASPTYASWTDFGPTASDGSVAITRTYTITNNGNTTLDLTGGPPVSTVGANHADFVVSTQPNATVAAGGGTTTFTITFTPHSATTETATVSIGNSSSGTPFTFEIDGEGESMTAGAGGLKTNVAGNGTGTAVQSGELLVFSYTGYLADGTKFGSSNAFEMVLGDSSVLAGLNEEFTGAKIGDQRTFIIPPALNSGTVPTAPAGQELIFVSTVSNIAKLQSVTPSAEILSGEASPTVNGGTDFGTFSLITSPAKTMTYQLSIPSGTPTALSSLLAASNPISIVGSSAFTVTQPTVLSASLEQFTVKYTPSVGTTNATVMITNATGTSNQKFEVQAEGPATSTVAQMTVKGNNAGVSSPIATGETSPSQATWTDFGPTAADGSVPVTRSYTITNSGNGTLDLSGPITIQNDTTDFSVLTTPAATVAAGQSTTFTIQFKPTSAGNKTTNISIASNDPNGPFVFEVQGEAQTTTGAANGLQIATTTPGSGAAAFDGELLVMNYTGYLLDGTKFDSSLNPGRTPFQFVLGQGNVIQGWDQGLVGMKIGESRTLIIPAALAYGATGSGSIPANATLIFTTTLLNIVSVAGTNNGVAAEIPNGQSVGTVANGTDFGTHALTDQPVTKTYTIWTATGSLASVLTGTAVTISGSSSFTVSPLTLNGNTGTFSVTYTPSKGQTAATVTIHNVSASQPNLTFGVQATGPTGVNSGTGPKISVIGDNEFASIPIGNGSTATDAQQLWTNFGDNAIGGNTSVTRTYKITNNGTTNLTFLGGTPVTVSGAASADYTVTSQPTGPIAPGASADFTITFAPKTPGTRQAIVTINSNDSQNPYTFLITGNGLVVTTGSDGLMTTTTAAGTGGGAGNGEVLVINYSGYLLDGTEFDSSLFPNRTPFQFVLGKGQVIKGWDEGLVGMKVGESRTLILPASLAYGSSGAGSIPPNATLIFKTTLLSVISVAGQVSGQDVFIADGDNSPSTLDGTEFGFVAGNGSDVTHTFVISAPQGDLTKLLAANPVSISGGGASAFTLSKPVINGGSATFTITYLAGSAGTNVATVSINNGTNGNPNLTFNVQGEGPLGSNGSVTTANTDQIVGFAYNPADFTDTVDVKFVWDGGALTQTVAANQSNTDVQNLTGQANHGFNYVTPMLTVGQHTVSIYAVDKVTGTTTFLGTRTITSQNSLFDENYYLSQNPDVAAAVAAGKFASGYDQYIQFGQFEGRNPNPYWNEKYYLSQNPDVAAAVAAGKISSGFMHYYQYGQYENRPGLVYFNTKYYLDNNPDIGPAISAAGPITSAFEHFCDYGQYEGRSPGLFFDQAIYEADNTDILPYIDGQPFGSAFEHYVLHGQYEGRTASNFFSGQTYLADNPDVKTAVTGGAFADGLQHWLEFGQYEGRSPAGPDAANIATEFTLLHDGTPNFIDYGNLPANVNNWIATQNT
jgi:FKBP-type peptidyl-prolyl cis-trans isomerase